MPDSVPKRKLDEHFRNQAKCCKLENASQFTKVIIEIIFLLPPVHRTEKDFWGSNFFDPLSTRYLAISWVKHYLSRDLWAKHLISCDFARCIDVIFITNSFVKALQFKIDIIFLNCNMFVMRISKDFYDFSVSLQPKATSQWR